MNKLFNYRRTYVLNTAVKHPRPSKLGGKHDSNAARVSSFTRLDIRLRRPSNSAEYSGLVASVPVYARPVLCVQGSICSDTALSLLAYNFLVLDCAILSDQILRCKLAIVNHRRGKLCLVTVNEETDNPVLTSA